MQTYIVDFNAWEKRLERLCNQLNMLLRWLTSLLAEVVQDEHRLGLELFSRRVRLFRRIEDVSHQSIAEHSKAKSWASRHLGQLEGDVLALL